MCPGLPGAAGDDQESRPTLSLLLGNRVQEAYRRVRRSDKESDRIRPSEEDRDCLLEAAFVRYQEAITARNHVRINARQAEVRAAEASGKWMDCPVCFGLISSSLV